MRLPTQNLRIIFSAFVVVLLFLSACSNDIEVNATGDPVPVVWCLLNPDVNEQYVRLGRSFIPDPNNPDYRPVADSTVWATPAYIYVEEWLNNVPIKIFRFDPFFGATKDSGYFPKDNLKLYKADFKPARLATYRLYVHLPDDKMIISGMTKIPGQPTIYDPQNLPGRKITLQNGVSYTVRWAPGAGEGMYQGQFNFMYSEENGNESSDYQVAMNMEPVLGLGSVTLLTDGLNGNRFLKEMAKQIPVKDGVIRRVCNVQFRLFKAGEELALMTLPDVQGSSISNSLNQYSNLINGIGIFSSLQQVVVNNLELSNSTINELAHSELTKSLRFKDIHDVDINEKHDE